MKLKSTQKFNSLLLALTLGCGAAFANTTAMTEVNTIVPDNEVTMIGDNEDAYARLNVQMTELEELYAKVNSEFQAIAPLMGSDWARTYGNQLAGIQGALNNMRSALETMYANIQLNNQSQLNDYESMKGQLTSLQATIEQTINGYVLQTILPDLTSTISMTMGSNIGNVQSKLNEAGKAEEYADRVNALIAKKAEAQAKLDEAQTAIIAARQAGNYTLMATTALEARTAIYEIRDEILAECEAILAEIESVDAEAIYNALMAQIAELEATYNTTWDEFMAIAPAMGSGWAQTYGAQLSGILGAIYGMKGTVGAAYQAGTLTEDYVIENYENIKTQLTQVKATVEQTINGYVLQTILPDLNSTISTTIGSNIGNVQSKLNEAGKAEEYADRVNALIAKKTEAQTKLDEAQTAIIAARTDGNYTLMATTALEARTAIYEIRDEILAECEAILAEIESVDAEAIYNTLMAQIAELEATYNTAWSEFMAIAPVMGSGWAQTYGAQFSGIQGAISGMKGTVGAAYQAGTLTEDYVIDNYDNIKGQLTQLQFTMEQTIRGQVVQVILPDLNSVTSITMGNAIADLQNELNELGKAEKYADRVNALINKKAEAQTKLQEYQTAIATAIQAGDYVLAMNTATEAKAYIYGILDEINTECEAILAEAKTVGISSVTFNGQDKSQVYSINGQRVNTVKKGLYIINGKKVLVK